MNLIKTPAYLFAPTSVFSYYSNSSQIMIEKYENYQKKSTRNRYDILTSQGIQTLSVPLIKGKNKNCPITEVKISYDENWIKNHLNSLKSAYGKSSYFEFYFDDIQNLFLKKYTYLFDLNNDSLALILSKLKVVPDLHFSMTYSKNEELSAINPEAFIKYHQVWEEKHNFTPNLSILDLLFNTGPESLKILRMMHLQKTSNL